MPSDPIFDHFDMGKTLDIGKISEIRLARSKLTGELRVVKIMNMKFLKKSCPRKYLEEVENLRKMAHPNIIGYHHYFQDKERFYIVTDVCWGNNLRQEINIRQKKAKINSMGIYFT